MRGVQHLGVILHAGQPPRPVLERGDRGARARRDHLEPVRRGRSPRRRGSSTPAACSGRSRMQVAHQRLSAPSGRTRWCRCARPCRRAPAPSPGSRSRCRTPARPGRTAPGPVGRTLGVHAGRAAGQHDRLRIAGLDLVDRRGVRNDLGVHPRLAHPARDQLGVLRTEIDDENGTGRCGIHRHSLVANDCRHVGAPAGIDPGVVICLHSLSHDTVVNCLQSDLRGPPA